MWPIDGMSGRVCNEVNACDATLAWLIFILYHARFASAGDGIHGLIHYARLDHIHWQCERQRRPGKG